MSSTVFRSDRSRLAKFDRTGSGAFVVPGHLSRTGIQLYQDSAGRTIREYRPPEEVFHPDSLASFRAVPVTIGHPRGMVEPSNFQKLAHGVVLDASGREKLEDAREYVRGQIVLSTADAITGAESGKWAELSVGYTARLDATPGVTPEGEPYDVVQRDIRANHLALLPEGHARAGRQARLRLDGHEAIGDEMDEKELAQLKADLKKATERADVAEAALQAAKDQTKAVEVELATVRAKADALEAEVKPLKADAAVREAKDVLSRAGKTLGKDYKADGKSAHEIRLDTLKVMKVDLGEDRSKNEAVVAAYFDGRFEARHDYSKPNTEETTKPKFDMATEWLALGKETK